MFRWGKGGGNGKEEQSPSGCGDCAVKSLGNCNNHLTSAAEQIAAVFIQQKTLFKRADPKHIEVVESMLAHNMKDAKGNHVVYELPQEPQTPTEPNMRKWFLSLVSQTVSAAL